MKPIYKKLLIILGALVFIYSTLFFLAPSYILLRIDTVDTNATYDFNEYFITDYDTIRSNLFTNKDKLISNGYDASIYTYTVDESDGLYIDTLYIQPTSSFENLICISTGVHGIEAYIGAVMVEVFLENILDTIDTSNTGIAIVNNVNPYGVKYGRRFNENNVDLNRNFIGDWDEFDLSINKDYPLVEGFLEPSGKIGNYFHNEVSFYTQLAFQAVTNGVSTVTNALVGGQYEYPNGVYYGGTEDQISTTYLKNVFNRINDSSYENILYFDVHSGYGSRFDMTIFNSGFDPMTEEEAKLAYGYDVIIAHDSEEFYATTGDTTEYFYSIIDSNKELYATCFEFGTLGDSLMAGIKSLKFTVEENRNNKYPTNNKTTQKIIDAQYMEMFFPSSTEWRTSAISSFTDAMNGVLNYYI